MTPGKQEPLSVVCLVLRDASGKIFATRRPPGKPLPLCWEFPGGKIETGENPEEALRREIDEELSLPLGPLTPLPPATHHAPSGSIELIPFLAHHQPGTEIHLHEHVDSRWLDPADWEQLHWAPADIPILKNLLTPTSE